MYLLKVFKEDIYIYYENHIVFNMLNNTDKLFGKKSKN